MSEIESEDDLGPGVPTPPIALTGGAGTASSHLDGEVVGVPEDVLDRLRGVCSEIHTDTERRAEASRDWWPLAMTWAVQGAVPALAQAVARPATPEEQYNAGVIQFNNWLDLVRGNAIIERYIN